MTQEKKEHKKEEQKEKPQAVVETVDDRKKVEETEKEAKENYNKWLYARAELENFKKRVQKEKEDLLKYGHERFGREVLHIVDALERALSHVTLESGKGVGLEEGIRLTLKQSLAILNQFGIRPIESLGKKFDPKFHQAIAEEVREGEEEIVVLEHQKGYFMHDRVLRPAHVVVSKKKEEKK